jgi:hypothetical protein
MEGEKKQRSNSTSGVVIAPSIPLHPASSLVFLDLSFNHIEDLEGFLLLPPKRLAAFQIVDVSGNPVADKDKFMENVQKVCVLKNGK